MKLIRRYGKPVNTETAWYKAGYKAFKLYPPFDGKHRERLEAIHKLNKLLNDKCIPLINFEAGYSGAVTDREMFERGVVIRQDDTLFDEGWAIK